MTTGTTEPAGRLARLSPAGGGARWAVRLNAPARRVLLTVLAEIEVLAELDECFERAGNQYVVAMCRVGVPYRPAAWFGGPLASAERQAYSRATRRLERTCLLRRVTEPRRNRVTHVRLTYAGIAVAVGFARRDAD